MKSIIFFMSAIFLIISLSNFSFAEPPKENTISGPFGLKPIQLSIGANGITQEKIPGFVCDLDASLGGGHYSDWGQTEDDARSIVTKKCSKNSGILLCKKDKAVCKQDK
jgi:hypothetical protein